MGLPEPANELYAAVKAISNPWPPDDEVLAGQLGQAWRTAGEAAKQAAEQVEASRQAVTTSWRDPAGSAFGTKLTGGAQSLQQISQGAAGLAGAADKYAQELLDAKTIITQTIAQHLPLYLQLITMPPVVAEQLAMDIAGQLDAMIAAKAAALGSAAPVPAPQPTGPAPAGPAPEGDSNAGTVGDIAGTVGDIAGVVSAAAGFAALFPPLTGPAALIAAASGGVALAGHLTEAYAKGESLLSVDTVNDAMGLLPAGKAASAVLKGVSEVPHLIDGATSTWNLALQAPTVAELAGAPVPETTKDTADAQALIPNAVGLGRAIRG